MKYTIEGFSQEKAVELGLTVEDLVILRWFVDFFPSKNMTKMVHDGKTYAFVSYKGFIEQMPIIGCNKRTIARKFQRLVEANVLENVTIKQGGSFSVYRFGSSYEQLLQKSDTVEQNCTTGLYENVQPPMYKNVHTNTNLYNSTNQIKNYYNESCEEEEYDKTNDLKKQVIEDVKKSEEKKLGFDDWYSHYPKKKSRGDAEKAWEKINPDQDTIKHMISAVDELLRKGIWNKEPESKEYQFTPYPGSWLRAKGWLDEEAQPPKRHHWELSPADGDGDFKDIMANILRNKVKAKKVDDN